MKIFILLFIVTVSIYGVELDSKNNTIKESDLNGKELKISNEILKYFSIEGYFRTQMNYQKNYDLNAFYLMNVNKPNESIVGSSKHIPSVNELKNSATDDSVVSYNTRFRFSPNIIVGEYLRAVATFDIFDNKLYGDNSNSLIFAKEAYFTAKTPFGLISLGRIATNWGLGINRNSGKGKFSNYGDYIDQIQYEINDILPFMPKFSAKLAYEIQNSTPSNREIYNNNNNNNLPAYDADDRDDKVGFSLYLENKMSGNELRTYLMNGKTIFNYGLYAGRYWKDKNIQVYNDNSNGSNYSYDTSYLDYYILDSFFELYSKTNFNIKGELVYIFGKNMENTSFNQWGGAIQSNFNFLMQTLTFGIDGGIASNDSSKSSNPYESLGKKAIYKKDNFLFNQDYDIDLIFFKEIYSLSGLYYIRPHISWGATSNISLNLWSVTSIALDKKETYGKDIYLGTEVDTSIEYLNDDGLNFGLRGGLYLPGSGMDWLGIDGKRDLSYSNSNTEYQDSIAKMAYSMQVFLIMKF